MLWRGVLLSSSLLLMVSTSVPAQQVFLRGGIEIGSGLTRALEKDCYVVTAGHVVKNAAVVTSVDPRRRTRGGQVVNTVAGEDLAVVKLAVNDGACDDSKWPKSDAVEATLKRPAVNSGTLVRIDEDGSRLTKAVSLPRIDDYRFITVTLPNEKERLGAGWSGAALVVGNDFVGIVVDVDPTQTVAKLYRLDYVNSLVDRLFRDVRNVATLLFNAVKEGDAKEVENLLKTSDINRRDKDVALQDTDSETVVELLLRYGASPTESRDGFTPLCWAVWARSLGLLRALVKHGGVDVTQSCNPNSPTAIVIDKWVKGEPWADGFDLLATLPGFSVNEPVPVYGSFIAEAIEQNRWDLASKLIKFPGINLNDNRGQFSLADYVCRAGQQALLKTMVSLGARGKDLTDKQIRRCVDTGRPE